MKSEVSIILTCVCPVCKHKFRTTLKEALAGLVDCPVCVAKRRGALLGEITRLMDGVDEFMVNMKAGLNYN